MAHHLTARIVRDGEAAKKGDSGKKRKVDQRKYQGSGQLDKRHIVAQNFGVAAQEPRAYVGPYPKCNICRLHHTGDCPKFRIIKALEQKDSRDGQI
ncbi:hypothetical protein Tco_1435670 [Tanacetum coccineum]